MSDITTTKALWTTALNLSRVKGPTIKNPAMDIVPKGEVMSYEEIFLCSMTCALSVGTEQVTAKQLNDYCNSYTEFKLLGKGATGAVCSFKRLGNKDTFAIKITTIYDPGTECDAENEFKYMVNCKHPNIVAVINGVSFEDIIIHDIKYFVYTMEYCPKTLSSVLLNCHLEKRLGYAIQVAQALVHIHKENIIHLDIKLENVLIDKNDNAKLADFGSAKPDNFQISKDHKVYGTHGYMAPELLSNSTAKPAIITVKADVYSFGILLDEIIAKQPMDDGLYELVSDDIDIIVTSCRQDRPENRPAMSDIELELKKTLEKLQGLKAVALKQCRVPKHPTISSSCSTASSSSSLPAISRNRRVSICLDPKDNGKILVEEIVHKNDQEKTIDNNLERRSDRNYSDTVINFIKKNPNKFNFKLDLTQITKEDASRPPSFSPPPLKRDRL